MRLVHALLFFASLQAQAANPCSVLLEPTLSTGVKNKLSQFIPGFTKFEKRWNQIWVRYPDESQAEDQYLIQYIRNATDHLADDFAPWFENLPNEKRTVSEILQRGHITCSLGHTDAEKYIALTDPDAKSAFMKNAYTGFYRNRKGDKDLDQGVGNFRQKNYAVSIAPIEISKHDPKWEKMIFIDKKTALKDKIIKSQSLKLDGIAKEDCPENDYAHPDYKGWIMHEYPSTRSIPSYLNVMQKRLTELRGVIDQPSARQQALNLIADYYQLGINIHLFPRVNNAILMGEVNYLLMRMGLNGIPHQSLDFIALCTDSNEFRIAFTEMVERFNPGH